MSERKFNCNCIRYCKIPFFKSWLILHFDQYLCLLPHSFVNRVCWQNFYITSREDILFQWSFLLCNYYYEWGWAFFLIFKGLVSLLLCELFIYLPVSIFDCIFLFLISRSSFCISDINSWMFYELHIFTLIVIILKFCWQCCLSMEICFSEMFI